MPQTSERARALEDIDDAIESAYILASDEEDEGEEEEHIQGLLAVQVIIASIP